MLCFPAMTGMQVNCRGLRQDDRPQGGAHPGHEAVQCPHTGAHDFVIYMGLDASADELGIKGYDTFVRETADTKALFDKCRSRDPSEDLQLLLPEPRHPRRIPGGDLYPPCSC